MTIYFGLDQVLVLIALVAVLAAVALGAGLIFRVPEHLRGWVAIFAIAIGGFGTAYLVIQLIWSLVDRFLL